MRRIYHLVQPATWNSLDPSPYRAESLDTEGFIHCSNADQVARVANRFYADSAELLVLSIDADRLTSPVRDEEATIGECFPHIYGPINREAILSVSRLERDAAGRWIYREPPEAEARPL